MNRVYVDWFNRTSGICHAMGYGCQKDYIEDCKWFNLCAAQSYLSAAQWVRDGIAAQMTSDQIAEGQQLTRQFRPRREGASSSTSPENPFASGSGFFITDDKKFSDVVKSAQDAPVLVLVY